MGNRVSAQTCRWTRRWVETVCGVQASHLEYLVSDGEVVSLDIETTDDAQSPGLR